MHTNKMALVKTAKHKNRNQSPVLSSSHMYVQIMVHNCWYTWLLLKLITNNFIPDIYLLGMLLWWTQMTSLTYG